MTKFLFNPTCFYGCDKAEGPYALPDGGVSRAASAARDFRRLRSIPVVSGCAPPNTRRAIRSIFSNVVTLSRRSSSVAAASS